jgi:tRNA modification GTPase
MLYNIRINEIISSLRHLNLSAQLKQGNSHSVDFYPHAFHHGRMLNLDDTIAAIATPPGEGGIGVIRLSGPQAIEISSKLFRSEHNIQLNEADSHRLYHGHVVWNDDSLDEVLAVVMRKPHSYTSEDVVEFQAHGSPVVLRSILEATFEAGARPAEPGEFTQRAFLNGRMSLDQAQGVLDVIQAKTQLSARYALDRLEGKFSQPLHQVRDQLTELLAGVGVGMDYPEYEEDAIPQQTLLDGLRQAEHTVQEVLSKAKDGRILREGFSIAIVGKPNVGKSTLLNALLNTNRALVTPVAGTTRDTLEEWVELDGVPFRLVDTAGLHTSDDEVEQLGMERTRTALDNADLALVMLDVTSKPTDEDRAVLAQAQSKHHLILLNKIDVDQAKSAALCNDLKLDPKKILEISAQIGTSLAELKQEMVRLVWGGELPKHEDVFFLDMREQELLRRAQTILQQSISIADDRGTLDLIAIDVQEALEVLGELTGESASEAVIERIFANFCVGK